MKIPFERIEWDHTHDLARFATRAVPAVVRARDEWHEIFRPLTPPHVDFAKELAVIVGAPSAECSASVDGVFEESGEVVVVTRLARATGAASYAAVRVPRAHPKKTNVVVVHTDDHGALPVAADPAVVVRYTRGDEVLELPGWTRPGALVLEHVPARGARVVDVRRGAHSAVDAIVDAHLVGPESFQVRDPSSKLIEMLAEVAQLPDEPPSRHLHEPEPATTREEAIPTPRVPKD